MADIVYKIVLLGLLVWAVFAHRFLFSLPSLYKKTHLARENIFFERGNSLLL